MNKLTTSSAPTSEVLQVTEHQALRMTKQEVNELMLSYRDQWLTVHACIAISINCDTILKARGEDESGLTAMTKLEASMRGRALLGMGRL